MQRSKVNLALALALGFLAAACSRAVDMGERTASDRDAATPGNVRAQAVVSAPRPVAPARLDDGAITGKVREGLRGDPALAGADISVNTTQGVVNLTGLVKSQEQAAIAAAHAQQDGVMRVDNHLALDTR